MKSTVADEFIFKQPNDKIPSTSNSKQQKEQSCTVSNLYYYCCAFTFDFSYL